jgi:hypothetical protein
MNDNIRRELRERHEIEMGERIGVGGFGYVHRATTVGGVPCAIKISHNPFDAAEGWARTEFEALKQIKEMGSHPHVVTLFDSWQIDGHLVTRWELGEMCLETRLKRCMQEGLPGIRGDELMV